MTQPHVPVLLDEVIAALAPQAGATYVDGTFGAGGYSRGVLEAAACNVIGIDRDPAVRSHADALSREFGGRFAFLEGRYGDMQKLLADTGVIRVDGIALDIGVSSMQIDEAARGFSFRADGPLDMRMGASGQTAADLVNSADETTLADIIFKYGEERHARRVARAIVRARELEAITRTAQLADIVRGAMPANLRHKHDGIDLATRTFQAIRIYLNDELGELDRGLLAAEALLAPGGRLAVVSFHSLEDRAVKNFLRGRSDTAPRASRHMPEQTEAQPQPTFTLLTRSATRPGDAECARNPRARSARLRAAERTDAPAWAPFGKAGRA